MAFSSDLSAGVLIQGDPQLAPGAPAHEASLYREGFANEAFQFIAPTGYGSGSLEIGAAFQGATSVPACMPNRTV